MTPDNLFDEFTAGFKRRKFSAGLLRALIDFFLELGTPNMGFGSFQDFLAQHPQQLKTASGGHANTLIVQRPGGSTLSLRGFYDKAERFYRAEKKRFDYPTAAPHATQAWNSYPEWLDSLVAFDEATLLALKDRVDQFVLDTLKSQEFDPASVRLEPPLFRLLLEKFDMTAKKGEPTGASYQGIVFGFLRADNPHLQIEIEKVRTGSKRLQRVGDVDGWEGDRLAISAEVKQLEFTTKNVPDVAGFANETGRRGALGLLVALSFGDGARVELELIGLRPLDLDDLVRIVDLWDPLKQRTAVASFVYYARHIEKNSSLSERLAEFLSTASEEFASPDSSQE
jgi:hypothetical protein